MSFSKYPKIPNARNKELQRVLRQYPELEEEVMWKAQEKLDGSNIQLEYDGQEFTLHKRSGPTDFSFFNAQEALDAQKDLIKELFALISEQYNVPQQSVTLCGELFGEGIQGRINYGKGKKFAFFDVKIDEVFIEIPQWIETHELFINTKFTGTLSDLLNIDVEQMKSDYSPSGDLVEGIVIKPCTPYTDKGSGTKIQFKVKREAFDDASGKKSKSTAPEAPSDRAREFRDQVEAMVTENRLLDLFSKHGQIEDDSQIGDYIKLFIQDMREEFDEESLNMLDKKEAKFVWNHGATIAQMLKKHL